MRQIIFLCLALILVGCTNNSKTERQEQTSLATNHDKTQTDEQNAKQLDAGLITDYFPPDGSTAYFQGEGNEFASYTLQTSYIDKTSIAQIENNGGVILLKVYRITNAAIELVYMEAVDEAPTVPTAQEIATFPVIETILQQPLQVGHRFDGWVILSTTAAITTSFATFHNVIELSKTKDNMTTTKYFAKGVGLIHTKDEMKTNKEEVFTVTSTLQKIE
ncbi:hypothetical protein FC756_13925 [Lysinibacillus mangiferihumi]|uniref:Uncharacterized protein n=1 Tax=Lysinibacillus mangiferihumi TaxID=1130819 RepID=A0A4U2Z2F0_9BACI|nr:hypothetical protein [Lysinibacillus mangiferihumi]TKI66831.1 hypothetical protein FC756_13925 [Lysinibacillus mangiferihumi]